MLPVFPPGLAKFHGFFAIMVVFGGIAALHLVELWGIVATKKDGLAILFNPECLMIGAMAAMHLVAYIAIYGTCVILHPKYVGVVFKKSQLIREKRGEPGVHGILKLAPLYKVGCIVKSPVKLPVLIPATYTPCMVFVQVAHEHLGYLLRLYAMGFEVADDLQLTLAGKAQSCIEQYYIAPCYNAEGLHLHQQAAGCFGRCTFRLVGYKYFIGTYGKSTFAEGDDLHNAKVGMQPRFFTIPAGV